MNRQICQICIIQDIIEDVTHECEECGTPICDNEMNHILDHDRLHNFLLQA